MSWHPDGLFTKRDYKLLQAQVWRSQNKKRMAELCQRWQAENPDRVLELGRRWRAENPERAKKLARAYRKRHPDRVNAKSRREYAARKAKDPDYQARRIREYRARKPGHNAEMNAIRHARKLQATPPWVDRAEIKRIYEFAAWLGWQVDHIHPLQGKNFCGLHVPWNLQVLSPRDNQSKGNRLQDA